MKTPMQELFYRIEQLRFAKNPIDKIMMIRLQMLEKEEDLLEDIIDIIDSENSGQSAEQRLDSIKQYLKTFNIKDK
jgi:hypothetical protein